MHVCGVRQQERIFLRVAFPTLGFIMTDKQFDAYGMQVGFSTSQGDLAPEAESRILPNFPPAHHRASGSGIPPSWTSHVVSLLRQIVRKTGIS
jgi:hypothetical protein